MTLSEIETTLDELSVRHNKDLTVDLLATLLVSAGWDDKSLKDAVILFKKKGVEERILEAKKRDAEIKAKKEAERLQQVSHTLDKKLPEGTDIVFLHNDGTEEKKLVPLSETPKVSRNEGEGIPVSSVVMPKAAQVALQAPVVDKEIATPQKSETPTSDIVFLNHDGTEERKINPQSESVPFTREEPLPAIIKKNDDVVIVPTTEGVFKEIPKTEKEPQEQKVDEAIENSLKKLKKIEEKRAEVSAPPVPSKTLPKMETATPEHYVPPKVDEAPPSSLVVQPEPPMGRIKTKEAEIPADLPLLPFESSPHVWSFSRYKTVFHGDPVEEKQEQEIPQKPIQKPVVVAIETAPNEMHAKDEEEIAVEKTPLTRGDESLVFLAGVMLLVIILILGYMYSNGRL